MRRFRCVAFSSLLAVATVFGSACSSSSDRDIGSVGSRGEFVLKGTEPVDGATIFLNDPIAFDFSEPVDLDSADLQTVVFSVLDEEGVPNTEYVNGTFALAASPGDEEVGRRLLFVPRYATDDAFQNGGFRAGSRYRVQLVGGKLQNGTVLRSTLGNGLEDPKSVEFTTVDGTQPAQLFRNPGLGGPASVSLSVSTATSLDAVPLALMGAPPTRIQLAFDQALNPSSRNVPVAFDTDPLERDIEQRGLIYLEYKDPEFDVASDPTDFTWIPANVVLERNDLNGSLVTLEPIGVLPNNAEVRVIVEANLEDISGENSNGNPSFDRLFGTFRTVLAYDQQWDAITEDFRDVRNIDFGAVFPESLASVGPGYIRAGFDFGGSGTQLDYRPLANEVVLNTSFTQIVPEDGLPFSVNGGVFRFRDVTIPQGVQVTGQGPNPMIWQCSGKFTVAGTLTVRGGNGSRVDTLRAANTAKAGGVGVCGGGNGGQGTPSGTARDFTGESGNGPGQRVGIGGRGGVISCDNACYTNTSPTFYNGSGGGSGGGGGGMATQGDRKWLGVTDAFYDNITPNQQPTLGTSFQQLLGFGGAGCSGDTGTRTAFLSGGEPGDVLFSDSRVDNNFWGSGIDLNRKLRIAGELQAPTGGGGGGGGGDTCSPDNQPWFADFSGGGGGAGGGVLIVQALEEIRITSTGTISADGGDGGGGEQAGNCGNAGGGGGGAGGMIVLMSAKGIEIEAHGNAAQNRYLYGTPPNPEFASGDFSFALSADGGIGRVGGFGTGFGVTGKYRPSGTAMWSATQYDGNPSGGVGGMGIVQLMAPPGDNSDGTNTILDDNIHFFVQGTEVFGDQKRQLLGWRGFPNDQGDFVGDDGMPTDDVEGDIRPAPTLLPSTLQVRSRVRSKWIDTGLSQRRDVAGPDGLPRGLDTSTGAVVGPAFGFRGTDEQGYLKHNVFGPDNALPSFTVEVPPSGIAAVDAEASYQGQRVYRVDLAQAVLGEPNRYVHYEAELLNEAGGLLQGFGIVAHDERSLWLDAARGPMPGDPVRLRVRDKFYEVRVNGNPNLGQTYPVTNSGNVTTNYPRSNVRIGFAFHRDPTPGGNGDRYPADGEDPFVYDLGDDELQTWLNAGAPRYIMWDVTFDLQYQPTAAVPPFVSSSTPLPELRFLRLPFRF